jgi:hypothetical protein
MEALRASARHWREYTEFYALYALLIMGSVATTV